MTATERKFTLSSVFTDVSKMEVYEEKPGREENHYGFEWIIEIKRMNSNLQVYIDCDRDQETEWTVQAEFHVELTSLTGKVYQKISSYIFEKEEFGWGFNDFVSWSELLKNYVNSDKLQVKFHVTIEKVTGIKREPLRIFDKSMEKLSDVVVKVGDQEFYVSKLTLASFSPYFEALFLGDFKESGKSEVELKNINPADFQDYLEVLYHEESPISDYNVEALLELGEMYDTSVVIRKCEEHLLNSESNLSRRDKIRLASRFNLKRLVDHCFSQCETVGDLCDMMPDDVTDFNPTILKEAFDKMSQRVSRTTKLSKST